MDYAFTIDVSQSNGTFHSRRNFMKFYSMKNEIVPQLTDGDVVHRRFRDLQDASCVFQFGRGHVKRGHEGVSSCDGDSCGVPASEMITTC